MIINKQKTFIIGDIHGMYDKLIACLQAVNFDYDNDKLIQLGDVVDRGPDSYLVVDELIKIKNLVSIKGNHDKTWWDSVINNQPNILFNQGGRETLQSYIEYCIPTRSFNLEDGTTDFVISDIPQSHIDFFNNQLYYYIDDQNNCFVHGGFNRHVLIEKQSLNNMLWDRDLWQVAMGWEYVKSKETYPFKNKNNFKEIFIGHTPTIYFGKSIPFTAANITDLDTGCGKGGLLTIMNLETREYKQF